MRMTSSSPTWQNKVVRNRIHDSLGVCPALVLIAGTEFKVALALTHFKYNISCFAIT